MSEHKFEAFSCPMCDHHIDGNDLDGDICIDCHKREFHCHACGWEPTVIDEEVCGFCSGYAMPLGTLGSMSHYKCRDCGIILSKEKDHE